MNKRGGLEPDKWIIGLVIFTIFVTAGILMIQNMNESYPETSLSTSDFDSNLNMTDKLFNLSQDIDEAGLRKLDETDTPNSMFAGAFSAIRLLTSSYRLVGNTLDSIADVIPVPPEFKTLVLTILTIAIIFAVVYLVFRFQPRR